MFKRLRLKNSVKLKKISKTRLFFLKDKRVFLFLKQPLNNFLGFAPLLFLFFFGCSSFSPQLKSQTASTLDSQYKLKQLFQNRNQKNTKSPTVSLYQQILRPSLYSKCDYYPSDSQYSQILSQKCGTIPSLFKTFNRFLREPDASHFGLSMVTPVNETYFLHLPSDCDVF